jgi:uncharacterized protein (TIGR02391 family)
VADIPTWQEALRLPTDELAIRLLRFLVELQSTGEKLNAWNLLRQDVLQNRGVEMPNNAQEYILTLWEAWAWLDANVLLVRDPTQSSGDWRVVTLRGREVAADEKGLKRMRASRRLDLDLHPRIEANTRSQFMLGEYELAVFAALREVEIRVRELSKLSPNDIGVKLMRAAFHKETGPLANPDQVEAEQDATAHLFAGAIGLFKNPSSHRAVDFDDPTVAAEIVLLADLLLRMLDDVERHVGRE